MTEVGREAVVAHKNRSRYSEQEAIGIMETQQNRLMATMERKNKLVKGLSSFVGPVGPERPVGLWAKNTCILHVDANVDV